MPRGRPLNPPLYTLPHGIEVIGEYAPNESNPYWRVRVRPHPFFDAVEVSHGHYLRRSRVVLASKLGRGLTPNETAHHSNEDKTDDSSDNLELLSSSAHAIHHKTGTRHSDAAKQRIAAGLKRAYQEGRHVRRPITNRNNLGRIAT